MRVSFYDHEALGRWCRLAVGEILDRIACGEHRVTSFTRRACLCDRLPARLLVMTAMGLVRQLAGDGPSTWFGTEIMTQRG
jgi:hypothetical protein